RLDEFHLFCSQAEDGRRDWSVTGVQTCALPIYRIEKRSGRRTRKTAPASPAAAKYGDGPGATGVWPATAAGGAEADEGRQQRQRSEERRVGKEGKVSGGGGAVKKQREDTNICKT